MIRVGAELHADLIEAIEAFVWEGDDAFVSASVMLALRTAVPIDGRYQIDDEEWDGRHYEFLRSIAVDVVEEDCGHSASSRGFDLDDTPIGNQLAALKEQL